MLYPLTKGARAIRKLPDKGYLSWQDFMAGGRRLTGDLPKDTGKAEDCGAIPSSSPQAG